MSETKDTKTGETEKKGHLEVRLAGQIPRAGVMKEEGFVFGQDVQPEDAFQPYYEATSSGGQQVFNPHLKLARLESLVDENSTLGPCVTAYEINIDGTGYVFEFMGKDSKGEKREPTPDELKKKEELEAFFKEPWPKRTFTQQRRQNRRHIESMGLGYIEAIRNPMDELMLMREVNPSRYRIVKPDATTAKVKMMRGGREIEIEMPMVHRRFAQAIAGNKVVFYKEFGAPLHVDRETGKWEADLPVAKRATELIVFECQRVTYSAYPLPRWIGQLPAVLGSRRAEEMNLEFFDSGGVPPFIAFVQGGSLSTEARNALDIMLSGKAKDKNKGLVLDIVATGGSLDDNAKVAVTFERFGGEQAKDALFGEYDKGCEGKVRNSFRLPPLFVGSTDDHNYATAFVSTTVAEAQVFQPEREAFDAIINNTVVRALDPEGLWALRSKPMVVKDTQTQLSALDKVKDLVSEESFVSAINEITHLELKVAEEGEPRAGAASQAASDQILAAVATGKTPAKGPKGPGPSDSAPNRPSPKEVKKDGKIVGESRFITEDEVRAAATSRMKELGISTKTLASAGLVLLAERAATVLKMGVGGDPLRAMELAEVVAISSQLSKKDQREFRRLLSLMSHESVVHDPDGIGELAACTLHVLASRQETMQ